VPNRGRRLQASEEMNVFQAEIGGDQGFVVRRDVNAGAVVADADHPSRLPSTKADATDERFFNQWQDKPMISDKLLLNQGGALQK